MTEFVWVPDPTWRLLAPGVVKGCRWGAGYHHPACGSPAVAEFPRGHGARERHWWAYCEDHLYGRRFVDGRVWIRLPADAELAECATEHRSEL